MRNLADSSGAARKVAFLDRDGIINEPAPASGYVCDWSEFRFKDGALDMLAALRQAGYRLAVVTNQQGVGKGLVDAEALRRMHERMRAEAERRGAGIDGVFVCPHLATAGCGCRKPKPGLIHRALSALGYPVDLERSWMVGDAPSDVQAGQRAGLRTLLVGASPEQIRQAAPTAAVPEVAGIAAVLMPSGDSAQPGLAGRD